MHYFKGVAKIGAYEGGAKIPAYFRKLVHEALGRIDNDTLVEFVIRPRQRTTDQNRFYYGIAVPLVQQIFMESGQPLSTSEAHEVIVGVIWKHTKAVTIDGKTIEVRRSSTEIDVKDWELKMTQLRAWCADKGYNLPMPDEHLLPPKNL